MRSSETEGRESAPVDAAKEWELTGNHAVSLPLIDRATGALVRVGVLHRGAAGVVEWAGTAEEPLLVPEFRVDGVAAAPAALEWQRLDAWIPRFNADLDERLRVRGTLCAPAGHEPALRGALYLLELENRGRTEREVEVALAGSWRHSLRRVVTERAWGERNRVLATPEGVALEAAAMGPALAIISGGAGDALPVQAGVDGAANGEAIPLRLARRLRVAAGKRALVTFYLGVAPEADGAFATALELRRTGGAELLRRTRLELARLARTPDRAEWTELLNRALFFNYFFAVGRAVDDDRFYAVSSRSPLLPAGATFRERDALLWSLPALTLVDPWLGRELLLRALEQYSHRAGEHLHYIDGAVLAPGFALDQACAYGIALERYVREARDETLHEEPLVQDVLRDLDDVVFHRLHPEVYLAATELLPSGDAADHPFVVYDNVLLRAFCRAVEGAWLSDGPDDRPFLAGGAEEVDAALWHECTVDVRASRVLAWSVDLEGEAAIYDDPAGSLALLPFLGFCDAEDPIWQATVEFLHSPQYPFWRDGEFPGLASRRHPGAAAMAALCADLLGPGRGRALELLARLPLLGGVAGEAWDPATGAATVGPHYAALSGFLGWALWHALEGVTPEPAQPAGRPRSRAPKGGKGAGKTG